MFAAIITIMVLDLKPRAEASFHALLPTWPVALSYGVSYLGNHQRARRIRAGALCSADLFKSAFADVDWSVSCGEYRFRACYAEVSPGFLWIALH